MLWRTPLSSLLGATIKSHYRILLFRYLFHLMVGEVLLITGAVTILEICSLLAGVSGTIIHYKFREKKVMVCYIFLWNGNFCGCFSSHCLLCRFLVSFVSLVRSLRSYSARFFFGPSLLLDFLCDALIEFVIFINFAYSSFCRGRVRKVKKRVATCVSLRDVIILLGVFPNGTTIMNLFCTLSQLCLTSNREFIRGPVATSKNCKCWVYNRPKSFSQ